VGTRAAGLLLHFTSLPGRHGIGTLGPEAFAFLDWAASAGQRVWQVLPIGPPGAGWSPYDAASAHAGNPLLVSPDLLVGEGLLTPADLDAAPRQVPKGIDLVAAAQSSTRWLETARTRFLGGAAPHLDSPWQAFRARRRFSTWLPDWALFAALREHHGGASWTTWDHELRGRDPRALAVAGRACAGRVEFHAFVQFLFFRQLDALATEARRRGVRLMGDLPIYVALDSADVWAHQELFDLDGEGRPRSVAGVPPDYFSVTGQRWGNPLYRWDELAADGYGWWVERLRTALGVFDLLRIDHFRGFAGYWAIPASEPTAVVGRWVPGPGEALFSSLRAALGELPIVAEDLGVITPDVEALRHACGFPGMKVLQFAFADVDGPHLPHNLTRDTVVYTGTHDNDTTRGWFDDAAEDERRRALDYLGCPPDRLPWALIRAAHTSVADLAVVPVQDVLGLGSEARMNVPATTEGNWSWGLAPDALGPDLAERLRRLTELSGRLAP
jgi:4-alpha-glucanotransferase